MMKEKSGFWEARERGEVVVFDFLYLYKILQLEMRLREEFKNEKSPH